MFRSHMSTVEDLLAEVRNVRRSPSPDAARLIRRAAKVTQERMAQALGVDRTTLARWEAGTMHPRPAQRDAWHALLAQLEREVAA